MKKEKTITKKEFYERIINKGYKKMYDFLKKGKYDYTISQISKKCKISRTMVRYAIEKNTLKKTREDSERYYKLNVKN